MIGLSEDADVEEVATVSHQLRVMTLNVWARNGRYEQRVESLRSGFQELAPDLVALQEVEPGPGESNQAEELLGPLGYQVCYQRRDGDYVGDPGIAIASRLPLTDRRLIELPHDGPCLAARVRAPWGEFWFASAVPMGPWPHQEGQREDECVALDDALAELGAGDDLPPILAGDFDATPDAASIRFLTGLQSLRGRSTAWLDSWTIAGDGSDGATWTSENAYAAPFCSHVFAEPRHSRRIDYVFVGSPFKWPPRVVVRSCRVVMNQPCDAPPSDHHAVLADLEVDSVAVGSGRGLEDWDATAAGLWSS